MVSTATIFAMAMFHTSSLLAAVRVLSPPVRLHTLLYGWQTDWLSLVTAVVDATLVTWYVLATMRLGKKGRVWSRWRTASFLAGIATIVIATLSGFAAYDNSVFYMHVIQHLLLMNLAPIFLVLGAPVTLALQASGRHTQTTILRVLHHPFVEFVTNPLVVLAVFSVTMIGYFLTPLYPFSLEHPLLHDYTHLHFLIIGYLYWSLVVGIDPSRWRLSVPMKLGFLAVGIPIATMLGLALTETKTSIAPAYHTLLDTHIGGSILWIVSEVFTFAAITIVVVQWMHSDMRDAVRIDRRADAEYARRMTEAETDGDRTDGDGTGSERSRLGADLAVTEVTVVDGRLVSVPSGHRAPPPG